METFATVLGYLGAICIAIFSSPQLIRVIKTKDTYSVPLLMFSILAFGSLCFTIQGITNICLNPNIWGTYIGVTIANIFSFILSASVLTIKLIYMYRARKAGMSEKDYCLKLARESKGGK